MGAYFPPPEGPAPVLPPSTFQGPANVQRQTMQLCESQAPAVANQVAKYAVQGMQILETVAGILGVMYAGASAFQGPPPQQRPAAPPISGTANSSFRTVNGRPLF